MLVARIIESDDFRGGLSAAGDGDAEREAGAGLGCLVVQHAEDIAAMDAVPDVAGAQLEVGQMDQRAVLAGPRVQPRYRFGMCDDRIEQSQFAQRQLPRRLQ